MDRLLPPVKYVTPPSPEDGRQLALELIDKLSPQLGGLVIAKMIIEQQGWKTGYTVGLSESSTIESLLMPLMQGGFAIKLNKNRLPTDTEARLRREAFLTGHEIAHSFFYRDQPGRLPRRITGKHDLEAEEAFCDEFGRPFSEW